MTKHTLSALLHQEGNLYVADCPEVGTVSQGDTVEEAIANLKEATQLYLRLLSYILKKCKYPRLSGQSK